MKVLDANEVRDALPWKELIGALRDIFREGCQQPLRAGHAVAVPGEPDMQLFMMPAWQEGRKIAVKMVCIALRNTSRNLPAVSASVILFDAVTGAAEAVEGVLEEAGDVIQPLANGTIQQSDIAGDLAALCRGEFAGRQSEDQISLFKSVGAALEDYAAVRLAVARRAS